MSNQPSPPPYSVARPLQNASDIPAVFATWRKFPDRYPAAEETDDRLIELFAYSLASLWSRASPEVWQAMLNDHIANGEVSLRELVRLALSDIEVIAATGAELGGFPLRAGDCALRLTPPDPLLAAHVDLALLLGMAESGRRGSGPALSPDQGAEALLESLMTKQHRARREATLLEIATEGASSSVNVRRS